MTSFEPGHLEAEAVPVGSEISDDPLLAYSQGRVARNEAIRLLGLRDYAELLVALGDVDLSMPLSAHQEIERQATSFTDLWHQRRDLRRLTS
jgi:hypothetical protein